MTIHVSNIIVRLGGITIFDTLTLTLVPGRLSAIIGANGAGKSTLIKAMSGELGVFGDILLHDRPIHDHRPGDLAALRAVLPQTQPAAFGFTVGDIMEMGLDAAGVTDPVSRKRVMADALLAVELVGYEHRAMTTLSGGQLQRAHFARILCQVPKPVREGLPVWLLLDEPLVGLDLRHQMQTLAIARRFARSGGGVVAVLHDLDLAATHADHVVLIHQGRVFSEGPPRNVLTQDNIKACFGVGVEVLDTDEGGIRILPPRP